MVLVYEKTAFSFAKIKQNMSSREIEYNLHISKFNVSFHDIVIYTLHKFTSLY